MFADPRWMAEHGVERLTIAQGVINVFFKTAGGIGCVAGPESLTLEQLSAAIVREQKSALIRFREAVTLGGKRR